MLTVVKVGGALARDREGFETLARGVAGLAGRVVVVHGGGPEITAWQERVGIPVVWNDGLRVTTEAGMKVTAMVLSGWINKRVVASLLDVGTPAIGLSGEDDLLRAVRKQAGALGEVGEIVGVNPGPLRAILGAGFTPVVSPVSRGPGGVPLNVNADEAALALAVALGAGRLLLVSDVPGVVAHGGALPVLTPREAEDLVADGVVTGGMAVKVRQALAAADAGVEVVIGNEAILVDGGAGTRVLAGGTGGRVGRPRAVAGGSGS